VPNDLLAADNAFYAVLAPPTAVTVLLIGSGNRGDSDLYLTRALAIGEAPRIDLAVRTPDTLSEADTRGGGIVVLNDVPVNDPLGARLRQFVTQGGGLFVAAGPHATWPERFASTLPAMPGAIVDHTTGAAVRLGALEYSHPVFEPFRAPRSGDFSAARFYAYRTLDHAPARVLARFDDGAPAIVDGKSGDGRVLVWASTLDLGWNDFPVKPVFLPFVNTAVKYLANFSERPAFAMVGQVVPAPRSATLDTRSHTGMIAIAPSGAHVQLTGEDGALELLEPGFYDIRTQGASADAATLVASNVDPAESDLTAMDPRELVAAITGRDAAAAAAAEVRPSDESQAEAQRIWWYLLVAAGLLLAAETLISNRASRA
jgi:hypothetical protein